MRSILVAEPADLRGLACPVCGGVPAAAEMGFKVVRDREVIGFVACASSEALGLLPRGALAIDQLWVCPDDVGELVGTQLVQRVAGYAHTRGVRFLVARGTHGHADCRRLPGTWLERVGFVENVRGVQWRLDLRRTVVVPDALRAAWSSVERLVSRPNPAPATGGSAQRSPTPRRPPAQG